MAAIDKTYLYSWGQYEQLRDWCKSVGTVIDDYGNKITPLDWLSEWNKDEFDECIKKQIEDTTKSYNNGSYKSVVEGGWMTQEEYDHFDVTKHIWGIVAWNTWTYFDVWLIRNCPLDFIQNRLKEQYGGGWSKQAFTAHNDDSMYEQIKNRTSPYDTYQRNGLGKNIKVNKDVFRIYSGSTSKYHCHYSIEVVFPDGTFGDYMIDGDYWRHDDELKNSDCGSSSSHAHIEGKPKFKTLYRRLQKWDLPKGTKVTFSFWSSHKHRKYRFYDAFVVTIGEKRKR